MQVSDAELVRRLQYKLDQAHATNRELSRQLDSLRRRNHHDVLCRMLERWAGTSICRGQAAEAFVNDARGIADLAYPPPKET